MSRAMKITVSGVVLLLVLGGVLAAHALESRSDKAATKALRWLRRHQHPSGSWSGRDFTEQCKDPKKPCKMKRAVFDGRGFTGHDVGVTALAVLAFAGQGYTHKEGASPQLLETMQKAVDWLVKQQTSGDDPSSNGAFGDRAGEQWVYDHAIATMALAEVLLRSRDKEKLGKCVEAAAQFCLRARNPKGAWRYGYRSEQNDTSVTGWMVDAIHRAKACANEKLIELDAKACDEAFAGALAWLDRVTTKTGSTGYQSPGDSGSMLQKVYPEPYPFSKKLRTMTASALCARMQAGAEAGSDPVTKGLALLGENLPTWFEGEDKRLSTVNMYYWYLGTKAMSLTNASMWPKWHDALEDALLDQQRSSGCEEGSWDPFCEWGVAGGRVYATAICAMAMDVPAPAGAKK